MSKKSPWSSFLTGCWGKTDESTATRTRKLSGSNISNTSPPFSPEDLSLTLAGSNLHAFTMAELKAVTSNFSKTNLIGAGGFGPVYKGYIDGELRPVLRAQHVAVKSLDLDGLRGHREWLTEVVFLGQLQHPHLVKLIGYCCEDENRMLIYEFMPRGSLEDHLFKRLLASLPWSTRLKIAVGAAKGLAFLHKAEKPVIYRDFKASNILLDSDYTAKLSDFGLAKDGPQGDNTHVTTRVMGARGYAAPEYVLTGHLTAKSDVYSFGVVLLELLAGRRCVDKTRPNRQKNLVDWARPYLHNSDKLSRVMDPNLDGLYSTKGAQKAAAIAYKCLSENPKLRPNMRAAVEALEPLLHANDVPVAHFVYIVPKYEEEEEEEIELDSKEKHRFDRDQRHKQRFPNSVIHSEITLHRDGNRLYRNSQFRRSLRQNQECVARITEI